MAGQVGIVIVENTFLIRAGIEKMLDELSGLLILEVFDGTEKRLCEKIKQHKPDMVLLNPEALGESFFKVVSELQSEPLLKLVGMCQSHTAENFKSRFHHCLHLTDGKHELMEQIRSIDTSLSKPKTKPDQSISGREAEILKYIALGLTNQEVADTLFLSIHTVTTHRKNITKKLGIKTVSGLTVYALMHQLISLNEIEGKA